MKTNAIYTRQQLHPHTIRYLNAGHPWVIKDSYTDKFSPQSDFILGEEQNKVAYVLLHDPEHKRIKARFWKKITTSEKPTIQSFYTECEERILQAIEKRKEMNCLSERENFFWIFSEGDLLPGIQLLSLNQHLILSFYAYFWKNHEEFLIKIIQKALPKAKSLWIQYRSEGQSSQSPPKFISGTETKNFSCEEFGLNYQLEIGSAYDFGLYTDMASIRKQMSPELFSHKKVLNLFSYTGAFSLHALKNQASEVVSVDSSSAILNALEKNLKENFQADATHQSLCKKVESVLRDYLKEKKTFQTVICDPPSAFHDGKKRKSVKDFYSEKVNDLYEVTEKNGHLIIFCNTHTFSEDGFIQLIKKTLDNKPFKIQKVYRLGEDCPTLKNFPEGNYLKGLLIQKY